jgi:hypothetical protein
MSLDPSPLSSNPTPLLDPTDPVPGRGAALVGAAISVIIAVVTVFITVNFGSSLLYLAGGIKANAQSFKITAPYRVNGFNYFWLKSFNVGKNSADEGYGSEDIASKTFTDEKNNYNMNMVIITITGNSDKAVANGTQIDYGDGTLNGYTDDVYSKLVAQARKAGLTPVFKLSLHRENEVKNEQTPRRMGADWYTKNDDATVKLERIWFNEYSDFAVHYAQLAQKLNIPLLIVGSRYIHMTTDDFTKNTKDKAYSPGPKDTYTCNGRRDCEWRHVVSSLRNKTYYNYDTNNPNNYAPVDKEIAGGGFTGKITYEAAPDIQEGELALSHFEWDSQEFLWWDALDMVSLDVRFRLTQQSPPSIDTIVKAWSGEGEKLSLSTKVDFVGQIWALARATGLNILFTSAGYESHPGSTDRPGSVDVSGDYGRSDIVDAGQIEQENAMRALYAVFDTYPWWLGVVWTEDYPIWPRSSLASKYNQIALGAAKWKYINALYPANFKWDTGQQWAGDCYQKGKDGSCANEAKSGGQWLHSLSIKSLPDHL